MPPTEFFKKVNNQSPDSMQEDIDGNNTQYHTHYRLKTSSVRERQTPYDLQQCRCQLDHNRKSITYQLRAYFEQCGYTTYLLTEPECESKLLRNLHRIIDSVSRAIKSQPITINREILTWNSRLSLVSFFSMLSSFRLCMTLFSSWIIQGKAGDMKGNSKEHI